MLLSGINLPTTKSLDKTQEVMLTKSSKGLGFSFIMCELDPPTREFGSMVRIKQLFPGQPAEQSGRIQEGDVLLALNGQSLKELSYSVCELSLHTALTVVGRCGSNVYGLEAKRQNRHK